MPATKTRTRTATSNTASGKNNTSRQSNAAAPIAGMPSETIGRYLAEHPDGATVREMAGATNIPASSVKTALGVLASAGAVVRVPGRSKDNPRTADVWRPAATGTPDTTTGDSDPKPASDDPPSTSTPAPATATASGSGSGDGGERNGETGSDEGDTAEPATPVSAPPAMSEADRFRLLIVAGYLGDHPDGITAADLAEQSQLRPAALARLLGAMEVAGAARRLPADESGVERWVRGEADPATVDLANAPTHTTCPTCGHRRRITVTVGRSNRASGDPQTNSDGQPKLPKGELRAMVLKFINDNPGQILTAGIIAKELARSSGAVRNNLDYLLAQGLIQHADDGDGKEVTALPTATDDQ